MTRLHFFGLLHIAEGEVSAMNLAVCDFDDQIRGYLGAAVTASDSLRSHGQRFTLLTNDAARLARVGADLIARVDVKEVEQNLAVPSGTSFFSAHFKFEAARFLSKFVEEYVVLCDLDIMCINAPHDALAAAAQLGIPLYYDVTDQMYSARRFASCLDDLRILLGAPSEGRWAGGEFVAGPPAFFARLVQEIDLILPTYFAELHRMTNVNDEACLSAALERMRRKGVYVGDAGSIGVVGRFWSVPVAHTQRPFAFFRSCFLLHLPADKRFLAELADRRIDNPAVFLERYERQLTEQACSDPAPELKGPLQVNPPSPAQSHWRDALLAKIRLVWRRPDGMG